jgi:hypothetical protein
MQPILSIRQFSTIQVVLRTRATHFYWLSYLSLHYLWHKTSYRDKHLPIWPLTKQRRSHCFHSLVIPVSQSDQTPHGQRIITRFIHLFGVFLTLTHRIAAWETAIRILLVQKNLDGFAKNWVNAVESRFTLKANSEFRRVVTAWSGPLAISIDLGE